MIEPDKLIQYNKGRQAYLNLLISSQTIILAADDEQPWCSYRSQSVNVRVKPKISPFCRRFLHISIVTMFYIKGRLLSIKAVRQIYYGIQVVDLWTLPTATTLNQCLVGMSKNSFT